MDAFKRSLTVCRLNAACIACRTLFEVAKHQGEFSSLETFSRLVPTKGVKATAEGLEPVSTRRTLRYPEGFTHSAAVSKLSEGLNSTEWASWFLLGTDCSAYAPRPVRKTPRLAYKRLKGRVFLATLL